MKICIKCGAEKPLTEFYKHPRMADGTVNKCKSCTKADVNKHREDNIEKIQEYDRNRPNKDERNLKVIQRNNHLYHSDENFKSKVQETKRKWIESNPLKRKAQLYATNAVRDGRLEKKTYCEHCKTTEGRIQKHHHSYEEEFWLDVVFLCTQCHGKEHRRLNAIGRDPDARGSNE